MMPAPIRHSSENYSISVKENANTSVVFEKTSLSLPSMEWFFTLNRDIIESASMHAKKEIIKEEDCLGEYTDIVFSYNLENSQILSHTRCYNSMIVLFVEIENISDEVLAFRRLSYSFKELECAEKIAQLFTYSSPASLLGIDSPSELIISPLMPQIGVLSFHEGNHSLVMANLDGKENFSIRLDMPANRSLALGCPIEDDASAGSRTILPGKKYVTDRIAIYASSKENPVEILTHLRRAFSIIHPPRKKPSVEIKSWWNSWYAYKKNIDEDVIKKSIDFAEKTGLDAIQIDDGWNVDWSCWEIDKNKFPEGLKGLVEYGESKDVKVMLWVWPYMISRDNPILKSNPSIILKRPDGSPVSWLDKYVIDPCHSDTPKYFNDGFDKLNKAGIQGYKVDFIAPLMCLENERLSDGSISPGEWMRKTWQLISEAIGPERIIHSSTPMAPSPIFWPYYDIVRIWGDNDPYLYRGLDGYALQPFAESLAHGLTTRMDADMIHPTKDWSFLCNKKFNMNQFLDTCGCAFVSGAFYICENIGNYNPEMREVVKKLTSEYELRAFVPDKLKGKAVYKYYKDGKLIVFSRRKFELELPPGKFKGSIISNDGSINDIIACKGRFDLKESEILILNQID
jgi:melibiase-like protein